MIFRELQPIVRTRHVDPRSACCIVSGSLEEAEQLGLFHLVSAGGRMTLRLTRSKSFVP